MIWLELLLFAIALVVLARFASERLAGWLRPRGERRLLERLAAGGSKVDAEEDRSDAEPGFLERRLLAAGFRGGVLGFSAVCATVGLLVLLLGLALVPLLPALALATGRWLSFLFALVAALWIPWAVLGAWARRRSGRFEEALIDAVGLMISLLEVGENPEGALAGASDAAAEPVRSELMEAVARLEAGSDIREALRPMVLGYDGEAVRMFAQTLIAKWRTGGDLAPILKRVLALMQERLALRLRLKSELAGAHLSSILVSLLPYTLIPVLLWYRADWVQSVVAHPLGLQLLFVALALQVVGMLWLRRLMRIEAR